MGEIFFTGCTHFGHKNIINFENVNRPFSSIEQHDETIVENWNKAITANDTVYHLGDVLFPFSGFKSVERLNGKKMLILGNHDRHELGMYAKYFTILGGAHRIENILLSHYPAHPFCLQYNEQYNVHAHIHSNKIDDKRYVNVSVEHHGLTPVSMDEVKKCLNA